MSANKKESEFIDQSRVSLLGSLGLLALGDVGFVAWRKVKVENNLNEHEEEK